jgi:hypothetical protein
MGLDSLLTPRRASHKTFWRSVRASPRERTYRLPADDLITEPVGNFTHAITIAAAARDVWPWLIQMGAGTRAGWYSYDFLDNGRHESATRLIPELQGIEIGTIFPALPGVTEAFSVLAFEPYRSLVLGALNSTGTPIVTWAFVLEDRGAESTRLMVRVRGARGYRFFGLSPWLSGRIIRAVHFVMERKQLLGIAQRVESADMSARQHACNTSEA